MVTGGGPKSSEDDAPTNCDHFWQAPETLDGVDRIGNSQRPPAGATK
jgi:hypothetical protein